MQLFGKDLEEWDKKRDLLKEIEEGVDEMIKNSTTTFYNVVSNVDEIFFTTTDKSLAEKYIERYNELKIKFIGLRKKHDKFVDVFRSKLYLELFGLNTSDKDFFEKTCDLTEEETNKFDSMYDEFLNNLPIEIYSGIFVNSYPELTIVESTDEFDFENVFVNEYLEDEDVRKYLKSLI